MFEIPNAKRVRRDELYGSSSDGGDPDEQGVEDAEERAKLNERLSSLLGLDLSAPAPAPAPEQGPDAADAHEHAHEHEHEGAEEDQGGNHDEEFEFRLFSGPAGTSAPAKVVLDASDEEDARKGDGAFVNPERPQSYYVAEEATPEQRERYRSAAVSAEDVAAGARQRAWGLERPWRVVKISLSSKKTRSSTAGSAAGATPASEDDAEDGPKRKRPGKKRRIAVRIKARAEKEKKEADKARREAAEKQRVSKEEHLLEKKKRLNREKKLKRRAKEKEKKLAAGETVPPSEAPTSPRSE